MILISFLATWVYFKSLLSRNKNGQAGVGRGKLSVFRYSGYEGNMKVWRYQVHTFILTLIAVLVMNIQVITRFLVASPVIYWFLGSFLTLSSRSFDSSSPLSYLFFKQSCYPTVIWKYRYYFAYGVIVYCLTYTLLGILLFPNFYPWT